MSGVSPRCTMRPAFSNWHVRSPFMRPSHTAYASTLSWASTHATESSKSMMLHKSLRHKAAAGSGGRR